MKKIKNWLFKHALIPAVLIIISLITALIDYNLNEDQEIIKGISNNVSASAIYALLTLASIDFLNTKARKREWKAVKRLVVGEILGCIRDYRYAIFRNLDLYPTIRPSANDPLIFFEELNAIYRDFAVNELPQLLKAKYTAITDNQLRGLLKELEIITVKLDKIIGNYQFMINDADLMEDLILFDENINLLKSSITNFLESQDPSQMFRIDRNLALESFDTDFTLLFLSSKNLENNKALYA